MQREVNPSHLHRLSRFHRHFGLQDYSQKYFTQLRPSLCCGPASLDFIMKYLRFDYQFAYLGGFHLHVAPQSFLPFASVPMFSLFLHLFTSCFILVSHLVLLPAPPHWGDCLRLCWFASAVSTSSSACCVPMLCFDLCFFDCQTQFWSF